MQDEFKDAFELFDKAEPATDEQMIEYYRSNGCSDEEIRELGYDVTPQTRDEQC